MMVKQLREYGFTLLEVMLVVIIIAVLAAIIMPSLGGRSAQAKNARVKADIANISVALGLYEMDLGQYPTTEQGLRALVENVSSSDSWQGPYIDNEPEDPWGQPYAYKAPGDHNPHKFDLSSLGADNAESDDDITNWKNK